MTVDAVGRRRSGQGFQTLVGEYALFAAGLRSRWNDESPLPYEEFAGPYRDLRRTLLEGCERLGEDLCHTGDGQIVMAARNEHVEHLGVTNVLRVQA
ncbi:hypothetical protein ACFQX6_57755 [Streptosporangium lutulentum]